MALPAVLAMEAFKNRPKVKVGNTTLTVLLATGLGAAAFFGIRSLVKGFKKEVREGQALNEGSPESYAVDLVMAFENDFAFGWGTDEELLFRTLQRIPSASMMVKVQRVYPDFDGSNRNLFTALQSDLSSEEYAVALEIINSKT